MADEQHTRYRTNCPICQGVSVSVLINAFKTPDIPEDFAFLTERYIVKCNNCGTIFQTPLEIKTIEESVEYGESYYNQMAKGDVAEPAILDHLQFQKINYNQLRDELLKRTTPEKHPRWLDVGSVGYATQFDDFEFNTVEPDPRAVAIGKSLFRPERIHCGVIQSLDWKTKFDGIVFLNSLYCVPGPNEALAHAYKSLNDDGLLVIVIGNHFVETIDPQDGYNHRIEDIFRGDVLWVYYNRHSLTYLCAKHGFSYIEDFPLRQEYSRSKSCRYFFFRKQTGPVELPSLDDARLLQDKLLDEFVQGLQTASDDTLKMIDRDDVAIIGSMEVIFDLWTVRPLLNVRYCSSLFHPETEMTFTADGIPFTPISEIRQGVKDGKIRHVVLATFKNIHKAIEIVTLALPLDKISIFIPTRQSGIEGLFNKFDGTMPLVKAFALTQAHVTIDNRNIVSVEKGAEMITELP